jgi:hypothetical protein
MVSNFVYSCFSVAYFKVLTLFQFALEEFEIEAIRRELEIRLNPGKCFVIRIWNNYDRTVIIGWLFGVEL